MAGWESDVVLQRLREYLEIPSVHPDINYDECVTFLKKQAKEIDLQIKIYEFVPKNPVIILTWQGSDPALPAIMLISHMDVVPVYQEFWTYPPFSAKVSEDGYIYARGAQDMKSIGMMHLEAVRRLKTNGVRLKRTVHISFVPDEEIGGEKGMKLFVESEEFRELNIGFELDESVPTLHPKNIYTFYGEKTSNHSCYIAITITASGTPGHGSQMPTDIAGGKLFYVVNKILELRDEQIKLLDSGIPLGEVISVNLTVLTGGVQRNVLPESCTALFDMRIPPHIDHDEINSKIETWCKEAGDGTSYERGTDNPPVQSTCIDGSVPFWTALVKAMEDIGLFVDPQICPGATDARFLRKKGIPAIGFSPLLSTPILLHGHDERIHMDAFKKGIDIFETVIQAIANV